MFHRYSRFIVQSRFLPYIIRTIYKLGRNILGLLPRRTFSLYRRSRRGVRVCSRRFRLRDTWRIFVAALQCVRKFRMEISGFFPATQSRGGGEKRERKKKRWNLGDSCNSFRNYGNSVYLDSFPSDTAFNVHINFAHAIICMQSWPSLSLRRAVINCCLLTAFTRTSRNVS